MSPFRPLIVPVRLSPLAFNMKVTSRMLPDRPGTCAVHLPDMSADQRAIVNANNVTASHRICRFMDKSPFLDNTVPLLVTKHLFPAYTRGDGAFRVCGLPSS